MSWQPIETCPKDPDARFDIAWPDSPGTPNGGRTIGCHWNPQWKRVALRHGYPEVETIFRKSPTHWRLPPAMPGEPEPSEAEIDRLRTALEPFAKAADEWDPERNGDHAFDDRERIECECSLTVGDLRRARETIRQLANDRKI
jgi:hypothetical protein